MLHAILLQSHPRKLMVILEVLVILLLLDLESVLAQLRSGLMRSLSLGESSSAFLQLAGNTAFGPDGSHWCPLETSLP